MEFYCTKLDLCDQASWQAAQIRKRKEFSQVKYMQIIREVLN